MNDFRVYPYIACPFCGVPRTVSSYADGELPCRNCRASYHLWVRPVGGWVERAACAETDPEAFFPYADQNDGTVRAAKAVCNGCEVRAECLRYALEVDEPYGIWGGLTPKERKRLKKKGGNAA